MEEIQIALVDCGWSFEFKDRQFSSIDQIVLERSRSVSLMFERELILIDELKKVKMRSLGHTPCSARVTTRFDQLKLVEMLLFYLTLRATRENSLLSIRESGLGFVESDFSFKKREAARIKWWHLNRSRLVRSDAFEHRINDYQLHFIELITVSSTSTYIESINED